VNNSRESLVFFSRLKVGYNRSIFETKDQVQAVGVALPTDKTALIIGCIVEFHI
jgi:hypothetical protein